MQWMGVAVALAAMCAHEAAAQDRATRASIGKNVRLDITVGENIATGKAIALDKVGVLADALDTLSEITPDVELLSQIRVGYRRWRDSSTQLFEEVTALNRSATSS